MYKQHIGGGEIKAPSMERNHETIVSVMGTVAHAAEETLKEAYSS